MRHLEAYQLLKTRLVPCFTQSQSVPPGVHGGGGGGEDEEAESTFVEPVECPTFEELCRTVFPPPAANGEIILGLEHTQDIEDTLACMLATPLSTSTSGGQLGLRVLGVPGTAKSILSEMVSCCRELVYPRSKFTGFVSGWSSIRKSQITANKANGKCILVKDSDTMLQLQNLAQIESEIRDAMGDGVIRADYRTGREFEIYTLFSMIMAGTFALKQMDDAILGARFLDIFIQKPGADTKAIVMRAIKSQSEQICQAVSGGEGEEDNKEIEKRKLDKIKPIIRKLGAPTVGFLLQKKIEMEKKKIKMIPLTQELRDRVFAMGELVAHLRLKPKRGFDKELRSRPEKENATRLGEQFVRMLHFLSAVFWKGEGPAIVGDRELIIASKILHDTVFGFEMDVVNYLYNEARGGDANDVAEEANLSRTKAYEICENLIATGILTERKVPNVSGKRGRMNKLYVLNDHIRGLYQHVRF